MEPLIAACFRGRAQDFAKDTYGKKAVESPEAKKIKELKAEIVKLEAVIHRLLSQRLHGTVSHVDTIINVVAENYDVSRQEVVGSNRFGYIIEARQMAYFLCQTLAGKSLPVIGRAMGGKDHSSVLHGIRKIQGRLLGEPELGKRVDHLTAHIAHVMTEQQKNAIPYPIVVSPKGDGGSVSPEPLSVVPGAQNG